MSIEIQQTMRRENKYYVNYGQYMILSSLLKSILSPDSFSNKAGYYFVRSMYFDSIDGKDCAEKEMGIGHRRKIRLRTYAVDSQNFKFETKEKMNKHTLKKSINISKEETKSLIQGDYTQLIDDHLRLYAYMKNYTYRPSVIIDYEREAYVSDFFNIRINFDMNIRGTKMCDGLFEPDLGMVPIIEPDLYVLEVKHDGHIPDVIQEILAQVDLTQVSYSKYYHGMML